MSGGMVLGAVAMLTMGAAKAVACTTGAIAENEKTDLWLSKDGSLHRKGRPLRSQRPLSPVTGAATTHTLAIIHSPVGTWHLLFELSGALMFPLFSLGE